MPADDELWERLGALEARVRATEDELAILRLISSYGPVVDSNSGDAVAALWAEGGNYELEGYHFTRDTMHTTVETDLHARYVRAGSAHVMSLPQVTLAGDRAVAINYSRVFVHRDGQWIVDRAAANRWDLERTPEGWRVLRRVNRLLDGGAAARLLLAGEIPPPGQA